MTHTETPRTPAPQAATDTDKAAPADLAAAQRHRNRDSVVLIALLATCAGIYLAIGQAGFSGVISAVAGLYGTWRMRH
ncbi:hypothetical protein GCM10010347_42540 [Streptomyces cirratus]|uniref:Uncharacterized protein n=1 Tax=Streptomyces cirratus TaxID=68187 RepID=A0ABQ3F0P1_9ACTN|nr:hypothetical protein [Streptomyces cirratus]GHB67913.1 hypothetical protein GCM10010347_42540 [Streptomyces cirratus]